MKIGNVAQEAYRRLRMAQRLGCSESTLKIYGNAFDAVMNVESMLLSNARARRVREGRPSYPDWRKWVNQ